MFHMLTDSIIQLQNVVFVNTTIHHYSQFPRKNFPVLESLEMQSGRGKSFKFFILFLKVQILSLTTNVHCFS